MKLTQSQRAILTSACDNEFGLATPPSGRAAGQADKMASALIEKGLVKQVRAKPEAPVWGKDEQGRDYALKILKAGRDAIAPHEDADSASKSDAVSSTNEAAAAQPSSLKATARRPTQNEGVANSAVATPSPRAGSKQALVIAMLREQGGVTLEALVAATGWLPHTTRAALTGLRKKGFEVQLERQDGAPSVYRITKEPADVAA